MTSTTFNFFLIRLQFCLNLKSLFLSFLQKNTLCSLYIYVCNKLTDDNYWSAEEGAFHFQCKSSNMSRMKSLWSGCSVRCCISDTLSNYLKGKSVKVEGAEGVWDTLTLPACCRPLSAFPTYFHLTCFNTFPSLLYFPLLLSSLCVFCTSCFISFRIWIPPLLQTPIRFTWLFLRLHIA